jgi:hypothetical protein
MWGPIGLILATPLTASFVVISRYVPALAVFDRLLSDRPALEPRLALYQRLLAQDESSARDLIGEYAASHSMREVCEELILGAVLALKRHIAEERIGREEADSVAAGLGRCIDYVARDVESGNQSDENLVVMGFPSEDSLDEIPLSLLRLLLRERFNYALEILSSELLIGERIARINASKCAIVCIPSLPPSDLSRTRSLCSCILQHAPDTKILVLRFSECSPEDVRDLRSHGALHVGHSFNDALEILGKIAGNSSAGAASQTLSANAAEAGVE